MRKELRKQLQDHVQLLLQALYWVAQAGPERQGEVDLLINMLSELRTRRTESNQNRALAKFQVG